METIENYINSGILELYVMGLTTDAESLEIKNLTDKNTEIQLEIDAIADALHLHSLGG